MYIYLFLVVFGWASSDFLKYSFIAKHDRLRFIVCKYFYDL